MTLLPTTKTIMTLASVKVAVTTILSPSNGPVASKMITDGMPVMFAHSG